MHGKYKTLLDIVRIVRGNTLAEFAVVSALMATLAATAAPKLSALSETAKAEKSKNELDKLLTQARTFYQKTQDEEGRGRFPGQEKFDRPVGNYGTQYISLAQALAAQTDVADDLENFTSYTSNLGAKWRSVFGISTQPLHCPEALLLLTTYIIPPVLSMVLRKVQMNGWNCLATARCSAPIRTVISSMLWFPGAAPATILFHRYST